MVALARRAFRSAFHRAAFTLKRTLTARLNLVLDVRGFDLHAGYYAPAQPVEVDVGPQVLVQLFQRTRAEWARLGETDPHWSVLAQDAYRRDRLDPPTEAAFYETGRSNADLLEIFEGRTAQRLRRGVCLELGCGVGRITPFLAEKFERVIGVDVSPANLELCRQRLAEHGARNVELVQLRALEDLADLPSFDLLYSMIVLQHNSPPVQRYMLNALLPKVQTGGGALFQAATNHLDYRFDAARYLQTPVGGIEMHALPQHIVFAALREAGLTVQEVAMDSWTGRYGSNTFFATR